MNYATIKEHDTANGFGIRVSLFVSGCTHHCKGCFNAEAWDFNYGQKYTQTEEDKIIELCSRKYIKGLSLLGGEPMEVQHQENICKLLTRFKEVYPEKTVWCYSGYTFDVDMKKDGKVWTEYTHKILSCLDVLVDGKFILEQRDLKLKFRGSANQRLIDVKKSLEQNNVVELKI